MAGQNLMKDLMEASLRKPQVDFTPGFPKVLPGPDLTPDPSLRSYKPTLRDEIARFLTETLGLPEQTTVGLVGSHGLGSTGASLADFTPAGIPLMAQEAGRDIGTGNFLKGGIGMAAAALPMAKAVPEAGKALEANMVTVLDKTLANDVVQTNRAIVARNKEALAKPRVMDATFENTPLGAEGDPTPSWQKQGMNWSLESRPSPKDELRAIAATIPPSGIDHAAELGKKLSAMTKPPEPPLTGMQNIDAWLKKIKPEAADFAASYYNDASKWSALLKDAKPSLSEEDYSALEGALWKYKQSGQDYAAYMNNKKIGTVLPSAKPPNPKTPLGVPLSDLIPPDFISGPLPAKVPFTIGSTSGVEAQKTPAELAALGFDPKVFYKGMGVRTKELIDPKKKAYEKGLFFADNPHVASSYGTYNYPVHLKMENPLIYDHKGKDYSSSKFDKVIEQAWQEGHDSVVFKNVLDVGSPGKQDQYVILKPHQARSVWANFDPAKLHLPDLLAGLAGFGALGAGMTGKEHFDPRLEDNPAFVRDPGNYQENNDSGQTNAAPFDPQKLPRNKKYEASPEDMARRLLLGIKSQGT